jgi:5-methylcytosine-specific restriction endonuclease McrA
MAAFAPSPSEELLQRILAILGSGRRSATYKPALLLALVELCVERAPADGGALVLPLRDVADRVLELYWPAARPYPGVDGVLRQATMPNSRISSAIAELRARVGPGQGSLGQVRMSHRDAVNVAVGRIAKALAMQPVPRLQRPGEAAAGVEYPRFLFDDSRYRTEHGALDREPVIELRPGIAGAMARNAALIRLAAQAAWVAELVSINRLTPEEHALREFMFGADRRALGRIADGLADLQAGRCFYCEAGLTASFEVDHVVPWSLHPNDDLFNLVVADRQCNSGKRDRLLVGQAVIRWASRSRAPLSDLARDRMWPFEPVRTGAVARAAYLAVADGIPAWRGRGQVVPLRVEDRRAALGAVEALLLELGQTA